MPYPWLDIKDFVQEEEKLGNVLRVKTPIKCGDYNSIVDIGNEAPGKQPETEIRAFVRYLHSLPGKPIGFIENPVCNRPDIPVVVNIWPNRERSIRALGCKTKDEFCRRLDEVTRGKKIKSRVVPRSKAPCKEVIIKEKDIDLTRDLSRCWVEFEQILWSTANAVVTVYDPETGTQDLGKLRTGMYEWKDANPKTPYPASKVKKHLFSTLMYSSVQRSDSGSWYLKYRSAKKPMPAAIMVSLPTDVHVTAAIKGWDWPKTGDEFDAVGGLRGEPVDIVESETIPGLKVLAHAGWVIEGEFLAEDEKMPPYAEAIASGYMYGGEGCPIFKVKCITHQKKPIWDAVTFSSNGMPTPGQINGHEGVHSGLIMVNCEVDAINFLRSIGFKIKDVVILDGGRQVAVIQTEIDGPEKPVLYYGKQILMAMHGNPSVSVGPGTKYLIVVGPDIDPYDFKDVMWAVGTRSMPVSDSVFVEKGLTMWGDPCGIPDDLGWKAYGEQQMIDALIKVPERFRHWPARSEPVEWEKAAVKRMGAKLKKSR